MKFREMNKILKKATKGLPVYPTIVVSPSTYEFLESELLQAKRRSKR